MPIQNMFSGGAMPCANAQKASGGRPISSEPADLSRSEQMQRSLHHARLCARVVDDFRGRDTLVLDLTSITPVFDYFVITTGTSRRQMHAIAEEVNRVLKAEGSARQGIEGYANSVWILQDYGDVVLHVFSPEARALYDLEHLWADAPRIDWQRQADQTQPVS